MSIEKRTYDRACAGCVYLGWASYLGYCKYIFVEDKRRPCPPGKGCTVKKKIKKEKKVAEND